MKKCNRGKRSNPKTWKYNVAKKRRSEGFDYVIKKSERPPKKPAVVNCAKCRYKCDERFSEDDRRLLCNSYWGRVIS